MREMCNCIHAYIALKICVCDQYRRRINGATTEGGLDDRSRQCRSAWLQNRSECIIYGPQMESIESIESVCIHWYMLIIYSETEYQLLHIDICIDDLGIPVYFDGLSIPVATAAN